MSIVVLGLALGLNASATTALDENPYMLDGKRQYQELIYQNRRVLGQELAHQHRFTLRHLRHRRASERAEITPRQSVRQESVR